jgi:hypothetical protein
MRRLVLLALFFTAAALPAHAQMRACTQIGCASGLNMMFENDTPWAHGDYVLTVKADGKSYTCTADLPFHSCDHGVRCPGEAVAFIASGCALPPEYHTIDGLMMPTPPKNLELEVRHTQSGKGFKYKGAPKVQCSYPNGKECDITPCCSAYGSIKATFK